MKTAKKLLVTFMCVLMLVSACTIFASAAKAVTKAQPKVNQTTSSEVSLVWEKVTGAAGYRIFKQVDGKWKKLADTKKLTYTAENLIASDSYKFAVRHYTVKNGEKVLGKSYGTVTAKTKAISKVTGLVATAENNTVSLQWEKLAGASGYRIYVKNTSGEWVALKTLSASNTSYTAALDSNFSKYTIGVRPYAKTSKGTVWGSYTTCKSAIADSGKAEITSASSTLNSITLNWTEIEKASGYRVYVYDKNGEASVIARTYGQESTSCTIEGLNSDSDYTFAIRAFIKNDDTTSFAMTGGKYTVHTEKAKLDIYRAEMVKDILNAKEFYIEYSEEDPVYGRVDSVLALRMGKLYLKETVNGVSTAYIFNTETEHVFVLDVNNKKYRSAAASEEYHILLAALREIMSIDKMGSVKVSYKNFAGETLICESFTEGKYGRYMELYFRNEHDLAGIYTKYADGSVRTLTVTALEELADATLFEVPSDYRL